LKRDCDNQWRVSADTDDTSLDPTVIAGWFTTPNVLDMAGAARETLTITKTGSGSILVNNVEYTAPVDLAEGAVVVLRFGATPTAFTVDAVDRLGEIENNVFAMAMPAADVAVAVTFA
jgi:hypothetical protein